MAKKIFLENPNLQLTTSYGFLAPCETQKRPDSRKDGRTEGWTERRTDPLFYRTLPITARGPTKTNKQCPIKEGLKDHVTDVNNQQLQGC